MLKLLAAEKAEMALVIQQTVVYLYLSASTTMTKPA